MHKACGGALGYFTEWMLEVQCVRYRINEEEGKVCRIYHYLANKAKKKLRRKE